MEAKNTVKMLGCLLALTMVGCAPEDVVSSDFMPESFPSEFSDSASTDMPDGMSPHITPELALDVWTGPLGRCESEVDDIRVMYAERSEVFRVCQGVAAGCYLGKTTTYLSPNEENIWLVVESGRDTTHAHELVHWLFECSGLPDGSDLDWNHDTELFQDTYNGIVAAASLLTYG